MVMTLEMPAGELDDSIPFDPSTAATANLAADLLERGEAEGDGGLIAGPCTYCGSPDHWRPDCPQIPLDIKSGKLAAENPPLADSNGKPEKKKRGRKPKADTARIELKAAPAPAGNQLKSPSPKLSARMGDIKTSPATRKFQIAKVEAEYIEVSLTLNANEEIIESAKAEVKLLSEKQRALALELRHLRNDDQWQPSLPLTDIQSQTSPPAAAATTAEASDDVRPTSEFPPKGDAPPAATANVEQIVQGQGDPNAWRSVSIDSLGLPPSITAKLLESRIDNLWQLEDLRLAVGQHTAKWPKGFGLAKVTLIEDALKKRISQSAATQLGSQPTAAESKDAPPAADPNSTRWPIGGEWEDLTEDQQKAFITRRADVINDSSPSCLDRKHPANDSYWAKGYKDFDEGEQLTDCIYIPGPEMDDYIRGYLAAKAVEDYPTAESAVKESNGPNPMGIGTDWDEL